MVYHYQRIPICRARYADGGDASGDQQQPDFTEGVEQAAAPAVQLYQPQPTPLDLLQCKMNAPLRQAAFALNPATALLTGYARGVDVESDDGNPQRLSDEEIEALIREWQESADDSDHHDDDDDGDDDVDEYAEGGRLEYQRVPLRSQERVERQFLYYERPHVGPLTWAEHQWQTHGQHLIPEQVLQSWPVHQAAQEAADHGLEPAYGVYHEANYLWSHMGAPHRITMQQARQYMEQMRR